MSTMFDTVDDPARTFAGLQVEAVAAYANGRYANASQAQREFPHAHHLEVDVSGQGVGNTGDFEAGDMPYAEAGAWAAKRIAAGVHRPVVYFQVSAARAVMAALEAAHLTRAQVRLWTAHYTGRPHLCGAGCGFTWPGEADATQWGSSGPGAGTLPPEYHGRDLDVSLTCATFWSAD
jgi:hypothetical protein